MCSSRVHEKEIRTTKGLVATTATALMEPGTVCFLFPLVRMGNLVIPRTLDRVLRKALDQ